MKYKLYILPELMYGLTDHQVITKARQSSDWPEGVEVSDIRGVVPSKYLPREAAVYLIADDEDPWFLEKK